MNDPLFEIDGRPSKPTQFGSAYAGEHRGDEEWAPASPGMFEELVHLRFGGNVDIDRESAVLALLDVDRDRRGGVLGDEPAPHRLTDDAL
jgi:hypothetical protein